MIKMGNKESSQDSYSNQQPVDELSKTDEDVQNIQAQLMSSEYADVDDSESKEPKTLAEIPANMEGDDSPENVDNIEENKHTENAENISEASENES